MNWSKKKRFVRDVARGAVGTKADAMAASTSSFAIIFALCMMAVNRGLEMAQISLSAAAQIKLIRNTTDRFAGCVGLANAIFEIAWLD
tara:strand:- start:266 stop:529 length:264 start_codon:yes stop_codon:yes gene_type:complete